MNKKQLQEICRNNKLPGRSKPNTKQELIEFITKFDFMTVDNVELPYEMVELILDNLNNINTRLINNIWYQSSYIDKNFEKMYGVPSFF